MRTLLLTAVLFGTSAGFAADVPLNTWLLNEKTVATKQLMLNMSPVGGLSGAIVASPQTSGPDYFYHWTRDAALAIDATVSLFEESSGSARTSYHDMIFQYADFSRQAQLNANMGEPKFLVTGQVFSGQWCRPQNDGPALRAMALIRFSNDLLDQGATTDVVPFLYDGQIPTQSVIKSDLEYVAHHWTDTSCDLWEEVYGDHFFTRIVQRRALLEGADLAQRLNDPGAASYYRQQANLIGTSLANFWNGSWLVPTLNRTGGLTSKVSGIDSAVILGVVHGDYGDGFLPMLDSQVESTFIAYVSKFQDLYPVNSQTGTAGVAIGRYPEDVYSGSNFSGGNPWVLLTTVYASYCYKAAIEATAQGMSAEATQYLTQGDTFLSRVQHHANADGTLSEQIDRNTGYMTSAANLTWNYVEILNAIGLREKALLLF